MKTANRENNGKGPIKTAALKPTEISQENRDVYTFVDVLLKSLKMFYIILITNT